MLKAVAALAVVALIATGAAGATGGHPPKPNHKLYKVCHNGHTILVAKPSIAAHLRHGDRYGQCPPKPPVTPPTTTPPVTPPNSPPSQVNRILACATKPVFRAADGSFGASGDVTAEIMASGMFQGASIVVARFYAGVGATCDNLGGAPNGKFEGPYPVWVR